MRQPFISFCIPTYNRAYIVKKCIEKINALGIENSEIVVCDNCSTDNTYELLNSLNFANFSLFRNEINIGFPNVIKVAMHGKGKYCFIMSDEDELEYDGVIKLIDFLKKQDDIGCVITKDSATNEYYEKRYDPCIVLTDENLSFHMSGILSGTVFLKCALVDVYDDIDWSASYFKIFPHCYVGRLICKKYAGYDLSIRTIKHVTVGFFDGESRKTNGGYIYYMPEGAMDFLHDDIVFLGKAVTVNDCIIKNSIDLLQFRHRTIYLYHRRLKDKVYENNGWFKGETLRKQIRDSKRSSFSWMMYSINSFVKMKRIIEKLHLGGTYRKYLRYASYNTKRQYRMLCKNVIINSRKLKKIK